MFKKFLGHSLVKNSFRIFSSNVLVQLISFVFLPVFSRIYSPVDYGIWGVFIFFSGFIAVFAGLRYELALMLPDSNRMAYLIFKMTRSIAFVLCTIALFFILIFYDSIISLFQLPDEVLLLLLVPIQAWLTIMNSLIMQWCARKGEFKLMANVRLLQSLTNILVSFIAGYFFKLEYFGLILGLIASSLMGDLFLVWKLKLKLFSVTIYRWSFYKKLMLRYHNFLFYSTPLGILNYYSTNILVSVLQVNYGAAAMGLYSNANRLIQSPLSLISSAVSMVFYPHFSKTKHKMRDLILVFSALVLVFSAILFPFVIWGEELLGFYLGEEWVGSAVFIRLLFVFFVFSTAVSCISPMFSYLQKENYVLIWQILYLASAVYVFKIFKGNLNDGIYYYSIMGGLAYFLLFCFGLLLVKKR